MSVHGGGLRRRAELEQALWTALTVGDREAVSEARERLATFKLTDLEALIVAAESAPLTTPSAVRAFVLGFVRGALAHGGEVRAGSLALALRAAGVGDACWRSAAGDGGPRPDAEPRLRPVWRPRVLRSSFVQGVP